MHSLLRVVLQNNKLNLFSKSKQLNSRLPIRQYSINSSRCSRTILGKIQSSRTLRTLNKYELPTSFVSSTKSFATFRDDYTESDDEVEEPKDLPATVAVPEVWPHLPVIATKKHPVFPRFMKIVEVSFN